MSVKGHISDRKDGYTAKVTKYGQLVSAPIEFSEFYAATAGTDDVPVNVVKPKSNKQFVITAMIISANRNVTAQSAITIYEASGPNATTQDKVILSVEVSKNTTLPLTGLNILISEGKWINAVADDDDAFINISGYYVISC